MLSTHDRALLQDLKLQPLWLLVAYVVLGITALVAGMLLDVPSARWLCAGGGFLIALGAEKLVSRRIRTAARQLLEDGADSSRSADAKG